MRNRTWLLIFVVVILAMIVGASAQTTYYMFPVPSMQVPQYSLVAEAFFVIGLALSLVAILLAFEQIDIFEKNPSLITAIIGLSICFIAAIVLSYSLIYVDSYSMQPYTISTFSQNISVSSSNMTTMQLGSDNTIGAVAYSFMFIDVIIGFAYMFLATFIYRRKARNKRYS